MLKQRWNSLLLLPLALLSSGFFNTAIATSSAHYQQSQGGWYVNASAGATRLSLPGSTLVPNGTGAPPPFNNDTYSIERPDTGAAFAFGGGYRWQTGNTFLPHYSLGAQYTRLILDKVQGTATQFSTPPFNNYHYIFNFDANLYTLVGKFDLVEFHRVLPYVAVGVGAGFSRVSNYGENAKPGVTPRTSPGYASNDNINFIYTLGAGFDYKCTDKTWATLGYEFEDLGSIASEEGTGSWSATKIKLGAMRNSMVFAALSYQFQNLS